MYVVKCTQQYFEYSVYFEAERAVVYILYLTAYLL